MEHNIILNFTIQRLMKKRQAKINLQKLQQAADKFNSKQTLHTIKGGFIGIQDIRDGS